MKKGFKYLLGMIATTLTIGSTAFAAEYSVTPVQATWYTNEQTVICEDADMNTVVVPACEKDLPVNIIGVTSNGYWQVQLDKVYYIPGAGLSEKNSTSANVQNTAAVNNRETVNAGTGKYVWHKKNWLEEVGYDDCDHDYTAKALYVQIRDELEKQYAAGNKILRYRIQCMDDNREPSETIRQVIWDMEDDHPDIEKTYNMQLESSIVITESITVMEKTGGFITPVRHNGVYEDTYIMKVK